MGYDANLGDAIGITLIATGFEQKDPFDKKPEIKETVKPKDEKIVMVLGEQQEEKKEYKQPVLFTEEIKDPFAPVIVEELTPQLLVVVEPMPVVETAKIEFVLEPVVIPVSKVQVEEKKEEVPVVVQHVTTVEQSMEVKITTGGFLKKPNVIYAETKEVTAEIKIEDPSKELPVQLQFVKEDEESFDMKLVEKKAGQLAAEESLGADQKFHLASSDAPPVTDEAEEQRKKAAERLQKLRNLSFNIHATEPNNEFESVPAYLRRNLELYNTISPAENFYSNYTVQSDENNQAQINTINTFLDGKKPD